MRLKRLEIFVIVAIIAVIGIIYALTRQPVLAPTNSSNSVQQVPGNVVTYQGVEGKNAFELLQMSHRVDYKHYDFGDLVTGIDGISPDASHFWAMYVNDQFSQVGASTYITKNSDTIRWQIDEIK